MNTVFPEAAEFIQTVYIEHPLIKHHKTEDVAEHIFSSVQDFISASSYVGGEYHAYFHAKKGVPKFKNEVFNVENMEVMIMMVCIEVALLKRGLGRRQEISGSIA